MTGMTCDVTGAKLSADRLSLEVEFDIYAFREDNFEEGQDD
jgi:hypothetical protein